MSIWDRYADSIYRVATGSKKRRMQTTPVALIIFFGLVVLFVFASFWVDRWLAFPQLNSSIWSLGLSVFLLALGFFLMFWPVIAFFLSRGTPVPLNPPPRLITTGLYAHIRNPMLLGLFIFMFGLGVLLGLLSLICIFTPLFIVLNVIYIKAIEEKEMEKKFGQDYLEYKRKVPMFIPRLRKRELDSRGFGDES
jgi:protein-S-isoprenylcysteine O-methyltransferase Ste14